MLTSGYATQSFWLNKLASTLGIDKLEFDESGCCVLKIDNELLLSIVAKQGEGLALSLSKPCKQLSNAALISILERNRSQYLSSLPVFSISIVDDTSTYLEVLCLARNANDYAEDTIEQMILALESVDV